MRWKKAMAVALSAMMAVSLAACGGGEKSGGGETSDVKYSDIKLGEDYTDLKADIKLLTNRTDMLDAEYPGKNWDAYLAEFNKDYPDIKVEIEGITDYAQDSLLRLQGGDWGDIMMIPEVDKSDLSSYFLSYGDVDSVSEEVKYPNRWLYDGEVYGIPCTVVGRGIVYNKKVFEDAGITDTLKTPEEFVDALKAIKDKTDAIPLYTNYVAGWTMGAWDDYTAVTATGDAKFRNQEFAHADNPFTDPGDGTGAYNVYKILYDAVENGLTEDDYSTTDWEGSKSMLNSGQVGCMVLGSWAYPQMQQAGDKPEDVGYMPFPMQVGGKLYSPADEDYCFGINVDTDADKQTAAMVFVKWMTEKSGYSYNEGGLPIAVGDEEYPEVYQEFLDNDVQFVSNEPAIEGEEDLLNEMNAESELMVAAGGNEKVQAIVEHAANKDMSFDEIMDEWNQKWSTAQENLGVEVK
ncbi:MAG: ABC transporter substrate-binding protein [Lachnospiraceae bacterium]